MKQKSGLLIILATAGLWGFGCTQTKSLPSIQAFPAPIANSPIINKLSQGFVRRGLDFPDSRHVDFIIYKMPKADWSWKMANDPLHPKTVSDWRENLNAGLVINGAYFDENMFPAGYYQLPGSTGTHTLAWPKATDEHSYSGLVQIKNGELNLTHLPDNPIQPDAQSQALLSFPTLLADGRALVTEDSKKYARRTVLAMDAQGDIYVVVTENGELSLQELSTWLAVQPEKFQTSINLDGGKSTGLSFKDETSQALDISSASVPNVLSATKKAKD